MDLLMVVAAIGAAAIGQVLDGALLIIIFATSGALAAVATKRTEDSVRGLLDLAPDRAARIRLSGPGEREEVVDAAALRVDDVILVRPGERIGGDGVVARARATWTRRPSRVSRSRPASRWATRCSPER